MREPTRSLSTNFFKISKRKKLQSLIKEFHDIDIETDSIEFSEALSKKYKESKTIVNFWKEHYKLCSTDERYLNATISQIYDDYLTVQLRKFGEIYSESLPTVDKSLPQTREELLAIIVEECNSIRNCKDNYADEKFIKEQELEQENLRKAYEKERDMLTDRDKKRMYDIKIREMHKERIKQIK